MIAFRSGSLLNLFRRRPTRITIDLTDRCNLRCITCAKWWGPANVSVEMTTDEWKKAIFELKQWLKTFNVVFSGGEPLLRSDIFELIDYAHNLGVKSHVITNGVLINERKAEEILASKVSKITLTLNGYRKDTHDHLRGGPGCYEKVMKAISFLNVQERMFRLGVICVLTGINYQESIDLVKWVKAFNLDSIAFQCIEEPISHYPFSMFKESTSMFDPEWRNSSELWFKDIEGAKKIIDDIIVMKENGFPVSNSFRQLEAFRSYIIDPKSALRFRCNVGNKNFSIDPYGNVRLCFNMLPIGNVRTATPKILWESKKSKDIRKNIARCQQTCRLLNCNFS